ncbi:ABC transporter related protein [Desulfarculus baarsii DSM 2075]|uniref:ABC transporter related protein n=1 Tax=Desulfarculus baarsii (strain ATCC 33931 / DSM 2075 / LMG 7858 / VKM B-1802 / 2st14) TaxID=644282 RepID=E1QIA4_DESB2|nr:ABC transporter ATP-binding protein [Desulfarculus baarsii]ADK85421.1 ABC transporter related protein [Desulfarculus baarsii DSM 2075]
MLEVSDLRAYHGDIQALWGVGLRVERGEAVALIGPNGAGKTTLLLALMGLVRAEGRVLLAGRSILGLPSRRLVRLGMCLAPEGGRLFAEMTCRDNLLVGGHVLDRRRRLAALERVEGLFPRLAQRAAQKASTLSGGERQMLALGRALMAQPALLLLDEPSLGLHPLLAGQVFEAIGRIAAEGVTVLLVEQKVSLALRACQRAYVLENGRVTLDGPSALVAADEGVRKAYLAL